MTFKEAIQAAMAIIVLLVLFGLVGQSDFENELEEQQNAESWKQEVLLMETHHEEINHK